MEKLTYIALHDKEIKYIAPAANFRAILEPKRFISYVSVSNEGNLVPYGKYRFEGTFKVLSTMSMYEIETWEHIIESTGYEISDYTLDIIYWLQVADRKQDLRILLEYLCSNVIAPFGWSVDTAVKMNSLNGVKTLIKKGALKKYSPMKIVLWHAVCLTDLPLLKLIHSESVKRGTHFDEQILKMAHDHNRSKEIISYIENNM